MLDCGTIAALFYEKGKSIGKNLMARKLNRSELGDDEKDHNGLRYWHFELDISIQRIDRTQIADYAVLLQKVHKVCLHS